MRWPLLASVIAAFVGAAVAAALGPYVPSWGVALGLPAGTLLFAVGTWTSEEEYVTWALRLTCAATLGFVALTVPVTWAHMAGSESAALEIRVLLGADTDADARTALITLWAAISCMVPVGLYTLLHVSRRPRNGV